MIRLDQASHRRLIAVARRAWPREACGLLFALHGAVTDLILVPTPATRNTPWSFRIRERAIERLRRERQELGEELVGCFHSHVHSDARPSPHDEAGARRLGGLWLIHSTANGRTALFAWTGADFEPRPLQLP